jgi:malonyl-CoA/methylmalonyl-CoA synthetase
VEAAIDTLPGVAESAVIGIPDPDMGEVVLAVVTAREGATLDSSALLAALKPTLARYKLPRQIIVMGALPRNAMGKVQKAQLRQDLADGRLA